VTRVVRAAALLARRWTRGSETIIGGGGIEKVGERKDEKERGGRERE